jgi:hypothetical protein
LIEEICDFAKEEITAATVEALADLPLAAVLAEVNLAVMCKEMFEGS